VKIYDSTFESNKAIGQVYTYGGAIYADTGAVVMIYDSTFESNTAGEAIGSEWQKGGTGGAIAAHAAHVEIQTSSFISNYAWKGGALYTDYRSAFHIADSKFVEGANTSASSYNGIAQFGQGSLVMFFCPNGTQGNSFQMEALELTVLQVPPTKEVVHCNTSIPTPSGPTPSGPTPPIPTPPIPTPPVPTSFPSKQAGLGPAGAAGVAIAVSVPVVAAASFFWWRKMKSERNPAPYKQDVGELLMEEGAKDGVVLSIGKKGSRV
jgi:predicted outer membrane repeat protein